MCSRKILALIIATLMILTMLPVSAFADEQASDDVMIEEYADEVTEEAAEVDSEVVEEAAEITDTEITETDAYDVVIKENNGEAVYGVAAAPDTEKSLYDNGDGTYTLSLSVTGQAETSSTTEVHKANVVLVLDTSSSMNWSSGTESAITYTAVDGTPSNNGTYYGINEDGEYFRVYWRNNRWRITNTNNGTVYSGTFYTREGGEDITRLEALQDALTKDDGIIDGLLAQNVAGDANKSDIIEIAIVNFDGSATQAQDFTTSANELKNTVNGLGTDTGTNWEAGLVQAKAYADAISAENVQPDEPVYIIFLTDGVPTRATSATYGYHSTADYWGWASDDAYALVTAGYTFYGLFTWGSSNDTHYLSSLVQFAYTGEGNSNSELETQYAKYYTDASDTETLISALTQIVNDITESVGYTNVELEDGVTSMTTSSVKTSVEGEITGGITYYRSGGSYGTADPDNGVYGTVWADAPEATINEDGEIDWQLVDDEGNALVLEDGVTYTMTFVVWPGQESLDLVADLNNRIIKYEDLSADQQAQIHSSGGVYTLKTNTDYPSVTYSTVTTTTVNGETTTQVSDPITTNITNPDPVGLSGAKLNAKKLWEDSLDESQREEINDVVLYLKVGGEYYYVDDKGDPLGVTLTEESNWTVSDYIYVAPGLMVTEDSPAYDANATQVTWEGVTYAILEDGHDYVFEESDINNHYELIAYTHHPMIMGTDVDGNPIINDVTFTKENGVITGIESVAAMGDSLSATNILKGGINISKKVVDIDDSTKELDVDDSFEITVHLTDADGNALPTKKAADQTEYTIDYRIYYGEKNPAYEDNIVFNEDGTVKYSRSDHQYKTGTSFTETLYIGDVIRVVNVENDALFYVEENLGANSAYDLDNVAYTIAYGTKTEAEYSDEDIVAKEDITWYKVKGNSASYAVVTNKCAPFYVYHSGVAGDGNLETVAVPKNDGTYDLTQNLTQNTLYGGYYLNYAGKGTYADNGVKGENGVVYTGMNYDWLATNDQVQTVSGKAMKPTARETYYIKEVPVYYLLNYYQLNYMKTDEQRLMSMYLISAIDDLNYKETGFTITQDNEKAKVASSVTFQNAATDKKVTLKANTVFKVKGITGNGSEKDKLTYYDLTPNTKFFKADSSFSVKPYWITPDGITVNGVSSREIKIETLTRKGVTKIDK